MSDGNRQAGPILPSSSRVTRCVVDPGELVAARDAINVHRGVPATTQESGIWRDVVADKRAVAANESQQQSGVIAALPTDTYRRPASPHPVTLKTTTHNNTHGTFSKKYIYVLLVLALMSVLVLVSVQHRIQRVTR